MKYSLKKSVALASVVFSAGSFAGNVDMLGWSINDAPEYVIPHMGYDLNPETRLLAEEYLVGYKGHTLNQVKMSDRTFILYNPKSTRLTEGEKKRISDLIKTARDGDMVAVTGYAKNESTDDLSLAESRAKVVSDFIRKCNPKIMIDQGSTVSWGGDDSQSRRTELFLFRSVE